MGPNAIGSNAISNISLCTIILLVLSVTGKNSSVPLFETELRLSKSIVEHDYIVTFKQYMTHLRQKEILEKILRDITGWKLIERRNPAFVFPSDFALIKLPGDNLKAIDLLKNHPEIVKHVSPQYRYVGILNEDHTPESDQETTNDKNSFIPSNMHGRIHADFPDEEESGNNTIRNRRLHDETSVPDLFNANYLWEKDFTGKGVRVAIFDTGLRADHPHFKHILLTNDWTDEGTSDDLLGHGTFVAGVVASSEECLGFASDAEIYAFRVLTTKKVSYTTWFLDAFNHAMGLGINILNLSIGGPDFNDLPFVEKVWEMSANNIIVISAIGNDGPTYGTLNNPADQLDVIGVGGITFKNTLARFSSRGMTTWELPSGYGRVKPDILAYAQSVRGSTPYGDCKVLSGTSVASPVVTGAVALLASTVPSSIRWNLINPASMKQVLIEGALPLPGANIFEQGYGKLDLLESYSVLHNYTPRVSFSPPQLDLTQCPYMWPYCSQPLYYSSIPVIVNVTILNGMGVTGLVVDHPLWIPGDNGLLVEISFTYLPTLWPWSGYLGIHIRVVEAAANWGGTIEGVVRITVQSSPGPGETTLRTSTVDLPIKANIIPTPPRANRLLWDQYHNLRYPSGYFPRDVLKMTSEPFDWNGDHLHTNFREFYDFVRSAGYFIEVLGYPYTCFNAENYGTLLIVDPEEEFFSDEIEKLHSDIEKNGLSVIVIADWYNLEVMEKIKFFDENSKQWWTPVTGGSNVPAINDVLRKYRIAFGDRTYDGKIIMEDKFFYFASGVGIGAFPSGGILVPFEVNDQSLEVTENKKETHKVALLGLYQVPGEPKDLNQVPGARDPEHPDPDHPEPDGNINRSGSVPSPGRIVAFGDSSCLDSSNKQVNAPCFWLLKELLVYTSQGVIADVFKAYPPSTTDYVSQRLKLPERMVGNKLSEFSKVIGKTAQCDMLDFKSSNISNTKIVIEWKDNSRKVPSSQNGLFREKMAFHPQSRSSGFFSSLWLPLLLFIALSLMILISRHKEVIARRTDNV